MKKLLTAAALAISAAPLSAQDQPEISRYDRALAAGYKALMLCGAIANADRAGMQRSPESVIEWELAGIQDPQSRIVADLPYKIVRSPGGKNVASQIVHVEVEYAPDTMPRIAIHNSQQGCSILPIMGGPPPVPTLRTLTVNADDWQTDWQDRMWSDVADGAFNGVYGIGSRTTAVVVVRHGKLTGEQYAPGFGPSIPQRTWSVAKSIAATLVGAAVYRGEVTLTPPKDGSGPAAVPAWGAEGDPRRAITLDHLLRMASGRYSDTPGNRTDPVYWGGATVDERAATWPLIHRPGTVYRYANNDTLMAVKAIQPSFKLHPPSEFFARLGMNNTVAERDWHGNYVLSSQVWSTARDLARLGQLYLKDGVWNGERLLPEGFVTYASSPLGPQPDGQFGYGAGFWLMNRSEGVPSDAFAAFGNRGQFVVIVPSHNVVIVRRGEDPAGTRFDIAAFTRDMLAAISE